MADEVVNLFPHAFVAGITILAVLLIIFNVNTFVQLPVPGTGFLTRERFDEKDLKGAFFTGINFTDQFAAFNFDFAVDNLAGTKTAGIGQREVSNGILFGEKSVRYTLEKGESVTIKFRIESTNALTPLVFRLGGKDYVYDLKEGIHEVTIDEPFEYGSVLEITTASSNWKIWAPSLYRLEGISINVKAFKEDVDQYIFNVDKEFETLQGGRMDLYLKENAGILKIELNGKVIFDGIARDFQPIRFSSSDIEKGQNILTFTATPESKFSGGATMVLFYKHGDQKEVKAVINLTEAEQKAVKRGYIRFKIVDVKENGGVAVRIKRGDETTFSTFARAETGSYSFEFTKDELRQGISVVSIEAIDGASFLVKELDVKLEKGIVLQL